MKKTFQLNTTSNPGVTTVPGTEFITQNMALWHKNYLEPFIFKKTADIGKALKTSRSYPFVRDIYTYKGNLHLKGCLPLCTRKRK